MDGFTGSTSLRVEAKPEAAFDLVTSLERLPTWNAAIERVIEQPETLTPDAEWVVMMHPRGLPRWRSRSRIDELDRQRCRFRYETRTDDGNPSYASWTWEVSPSGQGAEVVVRWSVHPRTVGRKLLGAPLRRRMLEHEVPASLHALGKALREASTAADGIG
jgi:hypothetical protein